MFVAYVFLKILYMHIQNSYNIRLIHGNIYKCVIFKSLESIYSGIFFVHPWREISNTSAKQNNTQIKWIYVHIDRVFCNIFHAFLRMYFLIFKQIFLKSQFRLSFLHKFILFPLKLKLIQLIQLILILIFVLTSIRVCGLELSGRRAERDLQIKSPQRKF